MELDNETLDAISAAIYATWAAIGPDLCAVDSDLTNYAAILGVVDADRLATFGGSDSKQANAIVRELFVEFGHMTTMTFLCKNFRLA